VIKDLLVLDHPKQKTAKTKGYLNDFIAGSTQTQFNYYTHTVLYSINPDIGFLEIHNNQCTVRQLTVRKNMANVLAKKTKTQRNHKKWLYYDGNKSARDINSVSNLGLAEQK
jgi:hypothetical protein